ncbi:Non-catalytic module family DOC2 [Piromyces sp. E2]|nr:Non-catalytic module family DOC2 [Piromyces sp. E2]|eukprot:OUM58719.1 Non-catalytic module family DOC2 [Piromyces sp. E2]
MKYLVFTSLLALGAFASECHPNYECCQGCEVVYTDEEGEWGFENNNWCFVDKSYCNPNYESSKYPLCSHCDIYTTDSTGNWGVENNNWCLIQDSQCTFVIDNTKDTNSTIIDVQKNVLPVISIVSKSGNNKFISEPIQKHVMEVSFWLDPAPVPYNEDITISVEDENGKKVMEGATGKAKVRGNFSTAYVKKSIRLTFDEKQELLGLNGGKKFKKWLLLAEYKDTSLLRDKASFALSREILSEDGLYVSDAKLVELNINNEYWGIYLLAEAQQINNGRVSITDVKKNYTATDIEPLQSIRITYNDNAPLTPYDGEDGNGISINAINIQENEQIIDIAKENEQPTVDDDESSSDDEQEEEKKYGDVPNDLLNMTIKSDIYSQEQHDFIETYINNVYKIIYEAVYNKKSIKFNDNYSDVMDAPGFTLREAIENVIDVNSLADMYIISELTCDADLFISSFYMDVDFGKNGSKKLRFEAPWDFDSGLGIKNVCVNGQGFYAGNAFLDSSTSSYQVNPWLTIMMYEDWYQDIIRNKWTKAYDNGVFSRTIDMIQTDSKKYEEAFTRNTQKWDNEVRRGILGYEIIDREKQCITEADSAAYVVEWLEARVDFMNNHWHK